MNTWSHLATTYDRTTWRLYINGTQVATMEVRSATYADHNFQLSVPLAAGAKVDVVFTNDAGDFLPAPDLLAGLLTIAFAGIRNSAHVGVLGIHLLPVAEAGP